MWRKPAGSGIQVGSRGAKREVGVDGPVAPCQAVEGGV